MTPNIKYIDIHGHPNFVAYDNDRDEVVKRALAADVAIIAVGTQTDTSKKAIELAHKYDNVYAAIGLHPIHTSASHHDLQEIGEDGKEFTSRGEVADPAVYLGMAKQPKVVAIGECGLDYYHMDEESVSKQLQAFITMIEVANEVGKPLMLHLRSGSGKSAYVDAFQILKKHAKVKGNLHFFAGSVEEAKLFLDLGFTFSFTGVVTFARSYDEVLRFLPLESIMSETDCPYVTPTPYRGSRNEPLYVVEVVKAIAEIRKEPLDMVSKQLLENARDFFNLKSGGVSSL